MAKFHISEYNGILTRDYLGSAPVEGNLGKEEIGIAQAVKEPSITKQAFAFAASTQSSSFSPTTKLVRLSNATNAICYYEIGPNPTATADSSPLGANATVEYIGVDPGDKIAVYDGTS